MQPEIEAKFLDVDHDKVRENLKTLGAELKKPMRVMRRTLFDYPDGRFETSKRRLRVRDEGDKVTLTFKRPRDDQYEDEIETTVGSYDITVELFTAIGLRPVTVQESKRETWAYKDAEVVLDEWPWLKPYIEIEGTSEAAIQAIAAELGFEWAQAAFGTVETAYRAEYLGIGPDETLGSGLSEITFNASIPTWLEERREAR